MRPFRLLPSFAVELQRKSQDLYRIARECFEDGYYGDALFYQRRAGHIAERARDVVVGEDRE